MKKILLVLMILISGCESQVQQIPDGVYVKNKVTGVKGVLGNHIYDGNGVYHGAVYVIYFGPDGSRQCVPYFESELEVCTPEPEKRN